ncbi:MAG: hypothetical protein Q8O33_04445 [Pseudomonadota bacterium]|nr:hypothetical protein [Pseudomonadota bacterium]
MAVVDHVLIDFDGAGAEPALDVFRIDSYTGSALLRADPGQSAKTPFVGQHITLYGQSASSHAFHSAGTSVLGAIYAPRCHAVMRVRARVTDVSVFGATTFLTVETVAAQEDFIRLYHSQDVPNEAAGTGYATGLLFLEAVPDGGVVLAFILDQGRVQNGICEISASVTAADSAYVPGMPLDAFTVRYGDQPTDPYDIAMWHPLFTTTQFFDGTGLISQTSADVPANWSPHIRFSHTVPDAPVGETGVAEAALMARVYTTGAAAAGLVGNVFGGEVGGGAARLGLAGRVIARGPAWAPLYAAVRGTRFAVRAASDPFAATSFLGAATLPLVANVYDFNPAGTPNPVDACGVGWKVCPGTVCMAVPLGWVVTYPAYEARCALPLLPFAGSGAARVSLLGKVLPVARQVASRDAGSSPNWYFDGVWQIDSLPTFFAARLREVAGTLIHPLQITGQGRPAWYQAPESGYWGYSGGEPYWFTVPAYDYTLSEVSPQLFDIYNYPERLHALALHSQGRDTPFGGSYPYVGKISVYDNNSYGRLRVSSMMTGHLRIAGGSGSFGAGQSANYEFEFWPDGQATYKAWTAYDRFYLNDVKPPIVYGLGEDVRSAIQSFQQYTLLPSVAFDGSGYLSRVYAATPDTVIVDTFLEDTTVYGGNRAVVLLEGRVGESGAAMAPLVALVCLGHGAARLILYARVGGSGAAAADLEARLFDVGAATADLVALVSPPGVGAESWWDYAVRMGGVDVSARVMGEITVEAEAGAARIAHFTLAPTGAPLDLAALGSAEIEIDYRPPGATAFWRLFTGKLAEPEIDIATGALACSASDQRAPLLDALDAEAIAALTPGALYSAAAQGADLAGTALAEARMATLAADLDLSPTGAWRLSPWAAAATPDFTLRENGLIDDSLRVRLMRYADVMPRVEVKFQYRYPLLRERQAAMHWRYYLCDGQFVLFGQQPFYLPSAAIAEAAEQDGWRVAELAATPAGANKSEADWTMRRRHVQTITEEYTLTVRAPLSEAAHGDRRVGERGGSLAVEFDESGWVDHVERAPLPTMPGGFVAGEGRAAVDGQSADGRDMANEAIAALLMMARRDILASLRGCRVGASLPCNPRIDLPHTVRIETPRAVAQARVLRLVHRLDAVGGAATTEIELAPFATPGTNPYNAALLAPPPPGVPAADLAGFDVQFGGAIVNQGGNPEPDWEAPGFSVYYRVYSPDGGFSTVYEPVQSQFAVRLPAIPDADAQPLTLTHAADYAIAVPIDDLTLLA